VPIPIPYTNNYSDHSSPAGFQFEFFCERCGNGYKSGFKPHKLSIATQGLRTLGGLFGGKMGEAGWAAGNVQDLTESQAKDKALREAVDECRPLFNQCHRCGNWVCKDICWNEEFNMCVTDAPKLEQELAAAQSDARLGQVRGKVQEVDWTSDVNVERKQVALCPNCGAEASQSGKFCPDCGQPLSMPVTCAKCGTESPRGTKFCPECGTGLAG
jgi:membrane protease subunit (stomatin/prohibitin family)